MTPSEQTSALMRAMLLNVADPDLALRLTEHVEAAIKSALKDALPGRQQKKNFSPIMAKAMKAAVRTLRRRAKR